MKVGFIGIGLMGSAMVRNLLRAGHAVTVWDRSAAALHAMQAAGAEVAPLPEAAGTGDVLLSALPNDQAARDVFLGQGLLRALRPGAVHVNHATISVALARELAAQHAGQDVGYVAAPMFGRPDVAAAGKLEFLLGGSPEAIKRVRPLLEAMGSRSWTLGDTPDCANAAKMAGNFMIAAAVEAMAEAIALTRAHGVDTHGFVDFMTHNLFRAPIYQSYGGQMAAQDYAGGGVELVYKDLSLVMEAGNAAHVPLPLASVVRDSFLEAIAAGDGGLNLSGLARTAARRANLPSPPA